MFDKFGELDSAEEINQAAAGLLAEGDTDNIYVLAKENGLGEEFAQAYIEGEIPELTNCLMAAVGKLEVERSKLKIKVFAGITDDLINYLLSMCTDESFARAIRRKGKNLQECMDQCEKKITQMAHEHRNGANQVGLSVRNTDVYLMEKAYYMKK